ncbi:DUF1542 domain-containing protein, partial [Lactobacillus crispatus]|uniref:DUF1542 domain-containing protein n=1 Tax=Lactobacillus crispatus TaxID=47770 RepID=UPI00117B3916
TTSATKDDAIKAINTALEDKKAAIKGSNLTDEEKAKLTNDANTAAGDAITNINQATTNDAVNTAKENGVQAIKDINVPTTSATKSDAKAAIDQATQTKDAAIDASNLTAEEKAALKKTVDAAGQKAKDAIDAATKDADVTTAQTNGEKAINAVEIPKSSKTKNDANKEIDSTADAAKNAIDETSGLTADQKQTAKNQIDQAVTDAQENIKKASDNQGVADAKDAGKLAIDKVSEKAAIDDDLAKKIEEIKANTNLTAEEKAKLTTDANSAANDAKDKIQSATTNDGATKAGQDGKTAIEGVTVPTDSDVKKNANSDLDKTAAAAKKAIDETSGLTADQKQTAKNQIDQAVTDAQENIKKASDNQGVADAKDAGKLAIDKVSEKAAIDAAVAAKKSEIAQAPLTAEEAKPLNNLVDQDAAAAKAAIDAATTSAAVETAKNNGVETINNIKVPTTSATKDDANKAIDAVLAKKIEEINNANLTDDQKPSLIDQAQNAATQAKENIRNASTDEDVQTARNNGIAAIEEITVKSNSVDDQDNSATNAGDSSQTGHIQKDKFPEGTTVTVGDDGTATVTYPDGSKDVIAGTDLVIAPKSEDVLGSKYHSHKNGSNSSQADRVKGASTANGSIANAGNNLGVKGESDNAIGNNKATSLKTLPQTGTKDTSILGVLGMLLASLGLFVFKKKRDKE